MSRREGNEMATWFEHLPEFIENLKKAGDEGKVALLCQEYKEIVAGQYPNTSSRRRPMTEARKAVRETFLIKYVDKKPQMVKFPYFYTDSGKGNLKRLEHLAIKYLREEWNPNQTKPLSPPLPTNLIESLTVEDLGLSKTDAELVKEALKHITLPELLRKYAVKGAKAEIAERKIDVASMSNEQLINSRVKGSAQELIKRAIQAIHEYNEPFLGHGQKEKCWCVTVNAVKTLTGCRHETIGQIFTTYTELVEGYNYRHGLKPVQNRHRGDLKRDLTGFKEPSLSQSGRKIRNLPLKSTGIEIADYLKQNPNHQVKIKGREQTLRYELNEEGNPYCLETGEIIPI